MFGMVSLSLLVVGGLYGAFQQAYRNGNSRNKAMYDNEKYYIDFHGACRRTDSNHKILTNITDFENNDIVDIDLKTGEKLNRRPTIEKERLQKYKQDAEIETKNNKTEALEKGKYWYFSYEYVKDGEKLYYNPYECFCRRVSDDLLLDFDRSRNTIKDAKTGLILLICENDFLREQKVEKAKQYNIDLCSSEYFQKKSEMSKNEMLTYAKKIGAYL